VQHVDYFVVLVPVQVTDRDSVLYRVVVGENDHTRMEYFHVQEFLLIVFDNYSDWIVFRKTKNKNISKKKIDKKLT
jgi:hypothetical protein